MHKKVILSITMLASLAGCNQHKKAKQVAHKVDTFDTVDLPLIMGKSLSDDTPDGDVLSFFDEDLDEFSFADDTEDFLADNALDNAHLDVESSTVSWIDTAQDDNELETVYFEFNKYGVKPDQHKIIEADAEQIIAFIDELDANTVILIEGHACHSSGSSAYNLALSEKRAKYVRDLLVTHGVGAERVRIVGRGQEIPALVDGTPVSGDRAQQWPNRRVEIRLVDVV
jgi:outer membrane protein OmpA-like peptidoglycan-associated protein